MIADFAVTVLFYDDMEPMKLDSQVFTGLQLSSQNRVILPDDFRPGKTIIAVLEGEVKILNRLGDRAQYADGSWENVQEV